MVELVRAAALSGYFETMAALNADPAPLLREIGLSRHLLARPEQLISARIVFCLLERSAEVTGCMTFGLRMAPRRGLADLGVSALLIEHESSLREGLAALSRYRNRINPILVVHIENFGEGALIRLMLSLNDGETSRQANDLALSALSRFCTTIVGESWRPELACFTYAAPPASDLPIYQQLFGCPLQFDAEYNGLVLAADDLDRPSRHADPRLAEHARTLIEASTAPEAPWLSQQVEQSMLLLLPSGRANIQACAALLGVTERTLQRDLGHEGTSFTIILNRARMQLASQHLPNPHTPIGEIAEMLGYGSASAFTRWHHQTFGMSPLQRRKTLLNRAATASPPH